MNETVTPDQLRAEALYCGDQQRRDLLRAAAGRIEELVRDTYAVEMLVLAPKWLRGAASALEQAEKLDDERRQELHRLDETIFDLGEKLEQAEKALQSVAEHFDDPETDFPCTRCRRLAREALAALGGQDGKAGP